MSYSHTQFEIMELRARNQQAVMESLLAILAAFFIIALLPSLLIQYVYDPTTLVEQPAVLEYLPVVGFVLSVGYILFAVIGNIMREKKIKRLQQHLSMNSEPAGETAITDAELAELEQMVDEVLENQLAEEEAPKTKTATKSSAAKKKSTRKTKTTKKKSSK